jgi:predicted TIM-barrel fold metal-dependent hydrolase
MKLYAACGRRRLPVLFHCGPVGIETRLGRRLSQVRHYFLPVEKHPETTFVLGHSGALQLDLALEIARRYPNVYLEISSQSLTNVRRILDEADTDRVLFGSDWPFYHQGIMLAKLLIATVGREGLRHKVMYDNAARLLGFGPRGRGAPSHS